MQQEKNSLVKYLAEAATRFDNPTQWTDPAPQEPIPGLERPQVVLVSNRVDLAGSLAPIIAAKIRNVAVVGVNPTGFAAAFLLAKHGCKVSLLPSGKETADVRDSLQKTAVGVFFDQQGIRIHSNAAKQLRGSQVHCQSGYCGFVCEGRFIRESEEVGCIVTEGGPIYADSVIIAEY